MRVCVEFDPLTDPLTAGHGRNRETRTDRDRPVSFPLRPSASTRFTLPTVRNQQVSGSSPLAGSIVSIVYRHTVSTGLTIRGQDPWRRGHSYVE